MKSIITEKLAAITRERGITMLYACESGSRAWGFPSPDSDWDVRFIYVRPMADYLSIAERKDEISFPISEELDIYGWDLRKVLRLMMKSNVTPFEWLQSPIVYSGTPGFRDTLWALCPAYFSARANAHHYLGIARGALSSVSGNGGIKIKKLFYVLRPLLAAKWCIEKNRIAPIEIGPLLPLLPEDIRRIVSELIILKSGAAEGFVIDIDPELKTWIEAEMQRCGEASNTIEAMQFSSGPADEFFYKTIVQHDHPRP